MSKLALRFVVRVSLAFSICLRCVGARVRALPGRLCDRMAKLLCHIRGALHFRRDGQSPKCFKKKPMGELCEQSVAARFVALRARIALHFRQPRFPSYRLRFNETVAGLRLRRSDHAIVRLLGGGGGMAGYDVDLFVIGAGRRRARARVAAAHGAGS